MAHEFLPGVSVHLVGLGLWPCDGAWHGNIRMSSEVSGWAAGDCEGRPGDLSWFLT